MGLQIKPAPRVFRGIELDALKRLKKEEFLEKRKKAIEDGCCTVETRIGSLSFWTSRDAVTDLGHYVQEVTLGAVAGQAPKAITRQWKTAVGIVDLPGDVAIQAGKALADWTQEQFNHEAELMAIVATAETIEAVQAVVWEINDAGAEPEPSDQAGS